MIVPGMVVPGRAGHSNYHYCFLLGVTCPVHAGGPPDDSDSEAPVGPSPNLRPPVTSHDDSESESWILGQLSHMASGAARRMLVSLFKLRPAPSQLDL